jgi:hypothetical protein
MRRRHELKGGTKSWGTIPSRLLVGWSGAHYEHFGMGERLKVARDFDTGLLMLLVRRLMREPQGRKNMKSQFTG